MEAFVAVGAHLPVAAFVDSHMLCQIGLLSEALVAGGDLARERALTCVHAQVVKEVMPLSEEHGAVLVVALEYFDLSHRSRVLVSKDAKISRRWHCFINFD